MLWRTVYGRNQSKPVPVHTQRRMDTEAISSGEFSSRSEVVNDLIRRAREVEMIRHRLIAAEQSIVRHGWVDKTPEEMLDGFKANVDRDGEL